MEIEEKLSFYRELLEKLRITIKQDIERDQERLEIIEGWQKADKNGAEGGT